MDAPNKSTSRRLPTAILATIAALIFMVGLVGGGFYALLRLSQTMLEFRDANVAHIAFWQNEIVYSDSPLYGESLFESLGLANPSQVNLAGRIMALNPLTGATRDLQIHILEPILGIVADQNRLWLVSSDKVIEIEGDRRNVYDPKMRLVNIEFDSPSPATALHLATVQSTSTIRMVVDEPNELADSTGPVSNESPEQDLIVTASSPFLWNGCLTVAGRDSTGQLRLYSLTDGEWQAGQRIAVPGDAHVWRRDAETGQICVVPEISNAHYQLTSTTSSPSPSSDLVIAASAVSTVEPDATAFDTALEAEIEPIESDRIWLRVVQIGDQVHQICHLTIRGHSTTMYRAGFDFVPDDPDVCSAGTPANALADAAGWIPIEHRYFVGFSNAASIGDRLVLLHPQGPELLEQASGKPGQFTPLFESDSDSETCIPPYFQSCKIAAPATNDATYVVAKTTESAVKFWKVEKDGLRQLPYSFPGPYELMIGAERDGLLIALAAWIASNLILLAGADRIALRRQASDYTFGNTTVQLAPLSRRWLARGIDLTICLSPLITMSILLLRSYPSEDLIDVQSSVVWELMSIIDGVAPDFAWILEQEIDQLTEKWELIGVAIAAMWAIGCFIASVMTQAYGWGQTPGKWMCRIRTFQSTLRHCGIARSLLRELIVYVETLCVITPIPAVTLILLTAHRQRLGDRLSDTIVIELDRQTVSAREGI